MAVVEQSDDENCQVSVQGKLPMKSAKVRSKAQLIKLNPLEGSRCSFLIYIIYLFIYLFIYQLTV